MAMEEVRHRSPVEAGFTFGVAAGLVFALVQMLGAVVAGVSSTLPMRYAASVLLGVGAMSEALPVFGIFVFAATAHLVISTAHGIVFWVLASRLHLLERLSPVAMLAVGILYGAFAWFVDFQILARGSFTWMLDVRTGLQLLAHMFAFGAPLGVMFPFAVRSEREMPVRA